MARIIGSNSQDLLQGTVEDDLISGGGGDDVLFGNAGNDIIFGRLGQDILDGGEGNDVLNGGDDDDVLNGGDGNDLLEGEQGNDIFIGSTGNDVFSDDNGFSTLDYTQISEAITVQNAGVLNKGSAGTDQLLMNQFVVIGPKGFANTVDPFTGLTVVPVSVDIDLSANRFTNKNVPTGGDFTISVENFVNVIGSSLDDVIKGNDQDNVLIGGGGNDLFIGTTGNDVFSDDNGFSTVDYTQLNEAITLQAGVVNKGSAGTDQLLITELVVIGPKGFANTIDPFTDLTIVPLVPVSVDVDLSANRFTFKDIPGESDFTLGVENFVDVIGSSLDDVIKGNDQDNVLIGGGGNDLFIGTTGNDVFSDDNGFSTLDYTQLSEAITLQSGVVDKGSAGTDQLLITQEFVIIGPDGFANTIDPFTDLTKLPVSIDVDLSANRFTNKNIPGGGDFTIGVENFVNVIGSSLDDVIKGNDQDNVLIGGGGNDLFLGTAGNDIYSGGDGIDTIDYTGLGQAITLKNGRIEKQGGLGTDQGGGEGLIEAFIGDVGFANTLDSSNTGFSTQVNLATDSLIATGVPVLGRIEVTITNFVNVIGSSANDIIAGNDADNQLDGGGGNDIIVGSRGTDTLTGGDGRDTFVLGEAGNVFYLGEGFAQITDFDANTDTIQLAGQSSFYSLFENPVSGSVSISLDNGNGLFDADDDLIASVSILHSTFSSADNLIFA